MANVAAAMLARNSASDSVLMHSSSCFSDKTVAIDSARANSASASSANGFVFIIVSFLLQVGQIIPAHTYLNRQGRSSDKKKIDLYWAKATVRSTKPTRCEL